MSKEPINSTNQFSFEGKIHQLLNNNTENQLLVHVSEKDQLDAIHLLDLASLQILKSWTAGPDSPNISIRFFDEQRFVGISFSQVQNPDLIDVLVFEWEKQDPCFVFSNTKLLAANSDGIEIKHPMIENRTSQIDLLTGLSINHTTIDDSPSTQSHFPIAYDQSNSYFSWFEKIILQYGDTPVAQCEHLKSNGFHLISYYTKQTESLTNHLLVLDQNGNRKEKFTLAYNLKGIGKDTFFVLKNKAIFVSNYNELNVLDL